MTQVIYLIHFDIPLAHARHYIGATQNLEMRLIAHARGYGAALMEVLHQLDIGWEVSMIWTTPVKYEKYLKKQKNAPKYCPLCTVHPKAMNGIDPYPINLIKHPLKSKELK